MSQDVPKCSIQTHHSPNGLVTLSFVIQFSPSHCKIEKNLSYFFDFFSFLPKEDRGAPTGAGPSLPTGGSRPVSVCLSFCLAFALALSLPPSSGSGARVDIVVFVYFSAVWRFVPDSGTARRRQRRRGIITGQCSIRTVRSGRSCDEGQMKQKKMDSIILKLDVIFERETGSLIYTPNWR